MSAIKVLIADDEPKIRRGLKGALDWASLGMEVAAEAEDGETALEKALATRPDLLFIDICMPFLDGLELINRLGQSLPGSLVIVVTGHDEFAYAQQAVRLKVFDYLLKPVARTQLLAVTQKARDAILLAREEDKYLRWARGQLQKNLPTLRERFLTEWAEGRLSPEEVREQLAFFELPLATPLGMVLIKAREGDGAAFPEQDRQLMLFAVQNIVEELLGEHAPAAVFRDLRDHIVALVSLPPDLMWHAFPGKAAAATEKYLKVSVLILRGVAEEGLEDVPRVYESLLAVASREENWTPIVRLCKAYLDTHYGREDLSLQDVAAQLSVSPAYLSRTLRQELGASFIDYLIQIRMQRAAELLRNPFVRIYDVAKRVGYASQHYFSTAFKKNMGVSPAAYRKAANRK